MVGLRTSISQLEKNMKKHNAIVYLVSCLFFGIGGWVESAAIPFHYSNG